MESTAGIESRVNVLRSKYREHFQGSAIVCRAPGRVNLIGEHTDYNDGFVMPVAIGYQTWVAAGKRDDRRLRVYSEQFQEYAELLLDNLEGPPRKHWSDYVRGVAALLVASGQGVCGANLYLDSDVPLGAGLSSSAALELSVALSLVNVSRLNLPPLDLVTMSQQAEHRYAGTRCGIMDQFIAMFGQAGNALVLDCRSLDYRVIPFPMELCLAVCNSMVRHDLAAGEYNVRRSQCEEGVRVLKEHLPHVTALRDVTSAELDRFQSSLPEVVFRRCKHVVSENERVENAAESLARGDVMAFGASMYKSQESLQRDYEVSCIELDTLVELARQCKGVYGSRMTGGGFGGCTVSLVDADTAEAFRATMIEKYKDVCGITPEVYICYPAAGAAVVS